MTRVALLLAPLLALGCAAGGTDPHGQSGDESDAGFFEEEELPDAATSSAKPDAAPKADAATGGKADAGAKPDAATAASPDAAPPPLPDAATPDAPPVVQTPIVANGDFSVTAWDSHNLQDACTMGAPWGSKSWGINAETFSDPGNRTLDGAHFITTGTTAYLYGKEESGRWGFVRYIQGDVWGGGNCGAIPWNKIKPVDTYDHDVHLGLSVYRDTANLLTSDDSWVMLAVNVWFTSPDMPQSGGDLLGKKPLVMDLAFYNDCNFTDCGLGSYEDDDAYHYQAHVGDAPEGAWVDFDLALSDYIFDAMLEFNLWDAEPTLKLYQVEFVIELLNAEGAASVDDYTVVVDP